MKINFNNTKIVDEYDDIDKLVVENATITLSLDEYSWLLDQFKENDSLDWETEIFINPNKKI